MRKPLFDILCGLHLFCMMGAVLVISGSVPACACACACACELRVARVRVLEMEDGVMEAEERRNVTIRKTSSCHKNWRVVLRYLYKYYTYTCTRFDR